ncbi:MAG: pyruvate formate-lyase-activating protein [Bacteroidota bacterium]
MSVIIKDIRRTRQDHDTLKVHSIESFGTYDGPGIRMVIFLQGCLFQCLYCANPDTMCFDGGTSTSISQLIAKAESIKPFFANEGGVTVSGGEPCLQAKKLIVLFKELKNRGIHTCLDTNGYVMNKSVAQLVSQTDLVLLDVKHIDPEIHKKITTRSNTKTLAFARYLEDQKRPFWLRYVLVPGLSDRPEHLHQLGRYFQSYRQIRKLEIQPYHKLGEYKWKELGKEYPLTGTPENSPEQLAQAKQIVEHYFDEVVVN